MNVYICANSVTGDASENEFEKVLNMICISFKIIFWGCPCKWILLHIWSAPENEEYYFVQYIDHSNREFASPKPTAGYGTLHTASSQSIYLGTGQKVSLLGGGGE